VIFLGKFDWMFCAILDMEEDAGESSAVVRARNGQFNRG